MKKLLSFMMAFILSLGIFARGGAESVSGTPSVDENDLEVSTMAVVENKFVCDLKKPVQAQALKGNVFSLDNLGSRLSVLIYENGVPATSSGSITADCILPDGSTVTVNGGLTTENGGSKAYIDVPQSCLLIPGILKVAIKCTSSSVITTLAAIVANVYMTKTDNVITPSQQVINDWNAEISASLATIGTVPSGKTVVGMINEEATARENADAELKSAFNDTVKEQNYSITGSETKDFYINSGDTVMFIVSAMTGSSWVIFPEGNSSDSVSFYSTGSKIKTYSHSGKLRFYTGDPSNTITVKCYTLTRFDDYIENIQKDVSSLQIDTSSLPQIEDDIVYEYTEASATSTASGYRLNESDGMCSANASYKLLKFAVTAGDIVKVVSDDRFQFQETSYVPVSVIAEVNRVGKTYGTGTYILHVPANATYLIVSTPTTSTAKVYSSKKLKTEVEEIADQVDDLVDDCYKKVPVTGHFVFSGGASALSSVQLTSGVEYTIVNKTTGIQGGLIYIDGYTSVSKTFPAKDDSVKFTPSNTGYLKYYKDGLASGTDVTFTVIGSDVYENEAYCPALQEEVDEINNTLENMGAPTVYKVGAGKQYTSFVDCINALPASGSKVVYVYPGEYDIYDEMGGDDFVSSMSSSSSWYDVNPIIPPNTKIIGIGRVLFKYNCPDNIDDGKAVLLSCLNIRGSAYVENIDIECKNLRYAVHVEGSANSDFNNSKYEFINCHFLRNNGTYRNACVGIGLNYGCEIRFDGCTIDSEATNGNSLLIHGNVESLAGSEKMTIKNCVFLGSYMSLQLLNRYNSLAVIPVNIYNTYMQALIYKTTTSGQTCNDEFSITLVGCNNVAVTNSESIVNLRNVNRYNTIGN